jgi:hypothetical protein
MPSLILVAGMHRSGTSALTRAINLAGVPLPSNLMPPSATENADGFWESQELMYIHDAVLRSLKSDWKDPREIPDEWSDSHASADARRALSAWIEKEMRGKDSLLVKDPRVCRLLPLWQTVCGSMGIENCTIIPFRNPVEVARSLKARNGFPDTHSFFLWLRHILDAERFTRGRARSFVSFDQLMTDSLATVRRIAADLRLVFPVPDAKLGALLGAALKPALRHHVVAEDEVTETGRQIPALLVAYRWLMAAAEHKTPPAETLDEMTHRMRMSEQSRGIAIAMPAMNATPPA